MAFSGSAMVLPWLMLSRVAMTAFSTTRLPAVRAVISKPERIGTPLEMSVPSVRVKRATAPLRITVPSTGIFKSRRSMTRRPASVL